MKLAQTHITGEWQVQVGMRQWRPEPAGLVPMLGTQLFGLSLADEFFFRATDYSWLRIFLLLCFFLKRAQPAFQV